MFNKSLFIFRRDLRLEDNIALIKALESSEKVIPIFIFTIEQIDKNKFRSDNAVQFMIESLSELNLELNKKNSRLFYFHGDYKKIIKEIIKREKIDAIYFNKDYTKYAVERDNNINKIAEVNKIKCISFHDTSLTDITTIKTQGGTPFVKFTPFMNAAKKLTVVKQTKNKHKNYYSKNNIIKGEYNDDVNKFMKKYNENIFVHGGRKNGLIKLKESKNQKSYESTHNSLDHNTTGLSAYIKFGCVSIREVYYTFKKNLGSKSDLIKQLYWRDFYYSIALNYPIIFEGKAIKQNYDKIKWLYNDEHLKKWITGTTGFPLVDAGMRQLNTTGFMHNRTRLITSNFLMKVLRLNWHLGEMYFSKKLVDCDASLNTGNWSWSAGGNADSQEYYIIFNPFRQSYSHDKDCVYIKKWIPELIDVKPSDIHKWDTSYKKYPNIKYPKPMVDYTEETKKTLLMYKAIFDQNK
jgi:deoxyribodipyrimidine photo-lyase